MKATIIGIITVFAMPGFAQAAARGATTATVVAADGVQTPQIRCVGRLNVNSATRDDLAKVPGLDPATIETILGARTSGEISDLVSFNLPEEAAAHLKTSGESNFYRVQLNPLVRLAKPLTTSHR